LIESEKVLHQSWRKKTEEKVSKKFNHQKYWMKKIFLKKSLRSKFRTEVGKNTLLKSTGFERGRERAKKERA